MSASDPSEAKPVASSDRNDFTATHWTQIALAARQDGSVPARQALETLCARYWPAVYAFLRRKNYPAVDAEDLTQSFFVHLLEEHSLVRAERSKGRFRNFLLGALQRFLADEWRRNGAQKRGRGKVVLALDSETMEERYLEESDPALTPEQIYDRRWAATVLESAFVNLEAEFHGAGQSARFDHLKRFLSEEAGPGDYEACATRLGIAPKTVSSAVSRLRERYRDLARRQVLATVAASEQIDPEFRELFG